MDFEKQEVKAALEALGQRYKSLRARPNMSSTAEQQLYESSVKALDSVIKKFLQFQQEKFPPEVVEEPESDQAEEAEKIEERDYSGFRLLLVDDDNSARSKIRSLLSEQGFEHFDESDDGHSAIAKIKEKPKPYDLVLCDLNMPTISGIDVLKLIRQEEKYTDMPFIMVCTKGNKQEFEEAKRAGVNGYIVKPVTAENLIPKIDRVFTSQ